MKFLCPSCKAKYQIADEKVAGRSVRMKCRKCGFMIQVSSAIAAPAGLDSDPPERSDGGAPSVAPPAAAAPASPVAAAPAPPVAAAPAPPVAPAPPAAAAPAPPVAAVPEKSAPLASQTPASARPVQTAAGNKPLAPKAAALPAPRPPPGRPTGPVPKPAAPPSRASAPRPAATAAAPIAAPRVAVETKPAPVPAAPSVAARDLPRDFDGDDEVTRMADAGALAGAFTQAFGGAGSEPPEAEVPLSMPGDEWFVGINGVPVGPIRLSELRSKAASGAVSKESLVWRDGFEDWRPLKTYPELLAIVEEGVSSARASLTPFTPPAYEALLQWCGWR